MGWVHFKKPDADEQDHYWHLVGDSKIYELTEGNEEKLLADLEELIYDSDGEDNVGDNTHASDSDPNEAENGTLKGLEGDATKRVQVGS